MDISLETNTNPEIHIVPYGTSNDINLPFFYQYIIPIGIVPEGLNIGRTNTPLSIEVPGGRDIPDYGGTHPEMSANSGLIIRIGIVPEGLNIGRTNALPI